MQLNLKGKLKKFFKYIGLCILVLFVIGFIYGKINKYKANRQIQEFSQQNDPSSMADKLEVSGDVSSPQKEKFQYGILRLKNESKVKFWFISHHVSQDMHSRTIFERPNGKRIELMGYFCCEMNFDQSIADETELVALIAKYDGDELYNGGSWF